ncbi:MAG: glycine--tRNA ligase [Phycisphaerae bacterium]
MADTPNTATKMEKLVALCKRRGFIFQSSEIYGGINGFWDYGPLGVELKRNLKDAWWQDIVRCPGVGPDGNPIDMVGLDCTIIMHPKVWVASGHAATFADPMVDDRETKQRYRYDHVMCYTHPAGDATAPIFAFLPDSPSEAKRKKEAIKKFGAEPLVLPYTSFKDAATLARVFAPEATQAGTLTEPRQFNLMFESHAGPLKDEANKVYLRPETAQGIFANFRNVLDTSRVKIPFGIAQQGKAFRNEVTPRNYTFRSREFEQMEIEFFINPETALEWYKYWRDTRFAWWQSIGLAGVNLQLREHDRDELSHYAKAGAGTSDIEYKFPFTDPGFGELEGVAHRTDYDLRQHAEHSGLKDKLKYFDQELQLKLQAQGMSKEDMEAKIKYFPHVIEPSAGADRGTLALLCEAYTDDPGRPSGVVMKFHPRMAPIKAAIFPLVDKDGMPEIATNLFNDLRRTWNVQLDIKQNIGKRYARMDEAGTPFCFTIDTQTLQDQTVTVRHRDTLLQERINIANVRGFLADKMNQV